MAEITITGFRTRDVRFPTSLDKTGSDAIAHMKQLAEYKPWFIEEPTSPDD
ncbi:hypothetical protein F4813DRAFT_394660, partial [Daldinia decipiens]|uniref:uncharacterized protein n=1 Tax=Daldinia decipiens TaxID=326647 RepID=UPI0020C4BBA0